MHVAPCTISHIECLPHPLSCASLASEFPEIDARTDVPVDDTRRAEAYDECGLLFDFFSVRAASDPTLVALSWRGNEADDVLDITYAQLHALTAILAQHIGHTDQMVIPICLEKSIEMVVGMLAVSMTGKAYCNIEPDLPLDRRKEIIAEASRIDRAGSHRPLLVGSIDTDRDCDCDCIRAREILEPALQALRRGDFDVSLSSRGHTYDRPSPDALAYLVYTSGSTGKPKGICISHSNVAAFLRNYRDVFGRERADAPNGCRVLQFASYGFDVIVMNVWDTFAHGATLCVTSKDALRTDLAQAVRDLRCTHVDLTPTVSQLLLEAFPSPPDHQEELQTWREENGFHLRFLSTGSEPVPRWLTIEWLRRGVTVVNDYGPSETTVGVISLKVTPVSLEELEQSTSAYLPIGMPNGTNQAFVLTPDALEECDEGEICVGGPQVSLRGYVKSDYNQGAFIEHPRYGRLYRTGDIGRYYTSSQGAVLLECLGRKDTQVKINGLRIEVAEVEQHLTAAKHREIATAIVEKIEHPSRGPRLAAFLVLAPAKDNVPPAIDHISYQGVAFTELAKRLEKSIRKFLPSYMVPQTWLPMTSMPVQPSGKTDRKQLRRLAEEADLPPSRPDTAIERKDWHRDEIFQTVRDAWGYVLGIKAESLFPSDRWTLCGGDSIGFIRLLSVLRGKGFAQASFTLLAGASSIEEVSTLLRHPPSAEATHLDYRPFSLLNDPLEQISKSFSTEGIEMDGKEIDDAWPITATQAALIAPSLADDRYYYAQAVYPVDTRVASADRFSEAIDALVERTPMLRSVFLPLLGRPTVLQVVLRSPEVSRGICQVFHVENDTAMANAINVFFEEERSKKSFRWGHLLVSFRMFCSSTGSAKLCWSMHHAISDGWSLDLLHQDIACLSVGKELRTRPSFGRVARWAAFSPNKQELSLARRYWSEYMQGAEAPMWPPLPSERWPMTRSLLQRHWTGDLSRVIRRHGITPAIATRIAVYVALLQHSQLSDLVVGIVRSGRDIDLPSVEDIVGPCVSSLPARAGMVRQCTTLLHAMLQETTNDTRARTHQHITLGEMQSLAPSVNMDQRLFSTLITYQSASTDCRTVRLPTAEPPESLYMPTIYALSIEITPTAFSSTGFALHAYFDEGCLPKETICGVLNSITTILDTMQKNLTVPIRHILADAQEHSRPSPVASSPASNDDAPSGDTIITDELAERVKRAWSETLCIECGKLDTHTSFSQAGGTSVQAMRLAALLNREGLSIPACHLAALPTIASQTSWLASHQSETP